MSLPQPSVAIDNICSVVWNNTIYTYSSNAFQSLSLTTGAKWKTLAPGASVTGGVCVGSTPGDASQAGFYLVGGTCSDATYTGMQKYTYATGQWETITPQSLVTQSRVAHGAAYINATDSIVMYAGVQDGSAAVSQQTFAIQASAPYGVVSFQSTAPAAINPYVLPWSASEAVLFGGSDTNTQVMLFDAASGGWRDSGATLATPLPLGKYGLQLAVVTGDDNSKNLFTFDTTVSPNTVSRIVLVDGSGTPVANALPVKRSVETMDEDEAALYRRALTQANWPAYNSSLAPTTTRTNFGISQDASGQVFLVGGTTSSDCLSVFDTHTNGWKNATQMLVAQKKVVTSSSSTISSSSSTSSSSSATSTSSAQSTLLTATASPTASVSASATSDVAAASSTIAAAAAPSSSLSANALLGIILGSVAGAAIILLSLYLLCMRSRRKKQLQTGKNGQERLEDFGHGRSLSGPASSEKSMTLIADDSLPRPLGGGVFRNGHQGTNSTTSITSVGIMMGRVNQPRQPETKHSNLAHATSFKGTISRPILQTGQDASDFGNSPPREIGRSVTNTRDLTSQQQQDRDQDQDTEQGQGTRRSSGWNRYWSGGSALNLLGFGAGGNNAKRATVASDTSSNYSTHNLASAGAGTGMGGRVGSGYSTTDHYNRYNNRVTQDSATVPPLEIPDMPAAKPVFQRVNSGSPTISNFEHFLKHGPAMEGMKGTIERTNSQSSVRSGYSSGIPASVHESWDPTSSSGDGNWGAVRAPSSAYGPSPTPNTHYSTATMLMDSAPIESVNPLAPPPVSSNTNTNTYNGSSSNKKYVPTGLTQASSATDTGTASSDMSWLNLGDVRRV